jgi:PDZ domain
MNGFDRTPEGEEIIALLKRAAPPRRDARAQAARVLQRMRAPERRGWMGYLFTAGALAAAAAVAVILFFPPRIEAPGTTPQDVEAPSAASPAPGDGLVLRVREVSGDVLTLDSGLSRGLRTGDELRSGECIARVTATGIFTAVAKLEKGKAVRGDRLIAPLTEAMKRGQRFEFIGGDPGALYDFGAVLEPLPRHDAKIHGFSDGRALVVVETINSILRSRGTETSMAGTMGLQKGDVILSCNGLPVSDLQQFTSALELSRRGGAVKVRVVRGTSDLELTTR